MSPITTPFQRWMITITIMLVAVIEVLDMTIVNVALAPMMGALGTTSNQITWVITSYIISSAIFMILTGFLDTRYGRRNLLLVSVLGFMIASALCGVATNITEIVVFRTLQGIFGASLVPLSQTILRTTFPAEEQTKAMAIWGIGIMVAPVLGPTLGGYITQHLSWRWIFYLNVPVCLASFFMALHFIRPTATKKQTIDWWGMILMATGVACLQIFLDRGNHANWFQSNSIIILALTSVVTLSYFIIRGMHKPNNIINLKIFLDRNFLISTITITVFMMGVMGIMALQPLLLERFLGYPTETTGLIMAPRGIAAALGMVFAGALGKRIHPRYFMVSGLAFTVFGIYMMSGYNLETSQFYWIWSGVVQGFGMGLFMIPLATLSLSTLAEKDTAEGAGLFSFGRNLGSSIGVSLMSTIISRESQINWNRLSANINTFNSHLTLWLQHHGLTLHNPLTLALLQRQLTLQSGMIAFLDCFWLVAIVISLLTPLIFLVRFPKQLTQHANLHRTYEK